MKTSIFIILSGISVSIYSQGSENSFPKAYELYKNKAYNESKAILEKRIKNNEHDFKDFLLLSHNAWALEDVSQSIDHLYSALKLKPDDTEIYIELIKAYTASNRLRGGLEIAETAQKKFPNSKEIKLQKVYIQGKLGMLNTALKSIEDLKQESPNDPRPLNIEANLYFLQGDFEKAEMSLKWAISLKGDEPFYHNNLALLYEKNAETLLKTGKKAEAKTMLLDAKKSIESAIRLKDIPVMAETQKRIEERLIDIP